MIHEDASNVDLVFFEVVEGANSIEEGGIVDLRDEADLSTTGFNVTLLNVIEHICEVQENSREQAPQIIADG